MFNVIAALVPYLKDKLGVPVSANVPGSRPAEFVTIERTGGDYGLCRDAPNLAVQCWAETEYNAYTLALAAAEALRMSREHIEQVCKVDVTSVYSFPDTSSGHRRYQVDVTFYTRA